MNPSDSASMIPLVIISLSLLLPVVAVTFAVGWRLTDKRSKRRGIVPAPNVIATGTAGSAVDFAPPAPETPGDNQESNSALDTSAGNAQVRTRRLMSNAELAFYQYLARAINGKWLIAVQVPLDIVFKWEGRLQHGLYTMQSGGHIDYLLLHLRSGEPILGIELDDSTHNTPAARDRDCRKDQLFQLAGLEVLRFRVGESWGSDGIRRINEALQRQQSWTGNERAESLGADNNNSNKHARSAYERSKA